MMLALDTNAYVRFCRGDLQAVDAVQRAKRIGVPLVVIAELRAGFEVGQHGAHNEGILHRFLASPRVEILYPDDTTTIMYAQLYAHLRRAGTPIPMNDLWIASLVQQHRAALLSFDAHFDLLPQLARWL